MSIKRTLFLICILAHAVCVQAYTLIIDAGHGGRDAGAVGRSSKEKDINLKVALAFGKLIEGNCPGVKVIYTRQTDVFVELDERAHIANKNKADLFVSIHTNSTPSKIGPRGAETYTLGMHRATENLAVAKRENSVITLEKDYEQRYEGFDPKSSESYIIFEFMQDKNMENSVSLAKHIQKQFRTHAKRQDRGVHQAGFLVLRATSMPSVLVELGYINNPQEETYLTTKQGVQEMAQSLYKAFNTYYK
ncbi:MAG: N-acetylmuramoyl-L-alanine amidase [Bacteroidaceae bacterium]|nr:N-acetylmuramoyl-L-alanine amidase [Bacteroidaceae bacterium]